MSTTTTAKNRTVALPNHKNALTGGKSTTKNHDISALVDAMWNGTVFGPYVVPLSRRVE